MHAIGAVFLSTRVSARNLPSLVLRILATHLTLPKCMWQLPAGTPGIDLVRFIFDDVGQLIIECHQVKHCDVDDALSWSEAWLLVKNMRNWLLLATWLASSATRVQCKLSWSLPRKEVMQLWTLLSDCYNSTEVPTSLSDEKALHSFISDCLDGDTNGTERFRDGTRAASAVLWNAAFVVAVQCPCGGYFVRDRAASSDR